MRRQLGLAKVGTAVCAVAFVLALPHAREGGAILAAQDDPVALSDLQLNSALRNDGDLIARNISAALDAKDADLANSLVELAAAKQVALPADLTRRVAEAVAVENSPAYFAQRFATGLVTGNADDVGSLSGTVAGDLFVFGDIRDVVREGKNLAMGEDTDRLVLGLATAGLAVTAATFVTVGGAAPVRAGLTLVKDASKVGRIGKGLTRWASRSAREVVDAPALQRAVAGGSFSRPGETVRAVKAAFRAEKAGGLVRLAKDVGRIGEKAGTRGALDTLKIAEGPKDVARAAALAEAKGGKTRGILKLLGRGALFLSFGALNFTWWVFGAVMALFGFVVSIKTGTERMTQRWIDRRKTKRARKLLADAQAASAQAAAAQAATIQGNLAQANLAQSNLTQPNPFHTNPVQGKFAQATAASSDAIAPTARLQPLGAAC
ncbi:MULTISPECIES: hypothetical protein [Rhodopseudomonas]|uniref:hypothetical protein n=1 Tax=Rhodopseudomonas TaxID=1073 RepID=UPI000A939129|nr:MULTISPECIES: hypothetical protein [Rhodopseudomonas]MDF3810933.1 hypothetical protein [Rhodopseudomonas sp. BAL398]WOK19636.1 hypothetical protein RBJ75_09020 [Rhodopseudomonas sp. BAL398]